MAYAVFEGVCRIRQDLGKPIITATGFQAQAYVFRFFLDFPPYGVTDPPTAKDRVKTFPSESARWNLDRYNYFTVDDLGSAMLFLKSNAFKLDDLSSRFSIAFSVTQPAAGALQPCPLTGILYTSDPAKPQQSGTWQTLLVDIPFGDDRVGSFDVNLPFLLGA